MAWPAFHLPVAPPFPPMEAKLVTALAPGDGWQYEPKWDGFRCLAFRDGEAVALQSKAGQPLGRYFPEVVEAVRRIGAERFVLDGELLVPADGGFSFEPLLLRIHPARSRIERLARESPAALLTFDLLVGTRGERVLDSPLRERRAALEAFAAAALRDPTVALSPASLDRSQAQAWLSGSHGLEGVVAKRLDEPYRSGVRAMLKVKRLRTADCVVGGYRTGEGRSGEVASLLLGLYGPDGRLHYVGHAASLGRTERRRLAELLAPLAGRGGFSGEGPGGPSRWSLGRSTAWVPVAPEVVVEIEYRHASGGKFRHGTRFVRLRPDKHASACTTEQLILDGRSSAEP